MIIALVLVSIFLVRPAAAQLAEWKINPSDAAENSDFGYAVSASGDYLIVGAYRDDENGTNSGAAYVFRFENGNWIEEAKLVPDDPADEDFFGYSVGISGTSAVVGAPNDDDHGNSSGSAYVFVRNDTSWTQEEKLTALDAVAEDEFGYTVSIDGDYIVIGAPGELYSGDEGSVYVFLFEGSGWTEQALLTAGPGGVDDNFGGSVSIDGNLALVGAEADEENGVFAGAAYVFRRTGQEWTREVKLTPADGQDLHWFGASVAVSGEYALIGAYADDDNGTSAGAAYAFHYEAPAWQQQDKLTASDGSGIDYFGQSVSLKGDYALIGAYQADDNGINSGSAYLFKRDGNDWAEETKIIASDGAQDDHFGESVFMSDQFAVAGAHSEDDLGTSAGSAYVYEITHPLCNDITAFQSRCDNGNLKARILFANTGIWEGTEVEFTIDGVDTIKTTVIANGTGTRGMARVVIPQGAGNHTVELTDPPTCGLGVLNINCSANDGMAVLEWEDADRVMNIEHGEFIDEGRVSADLESSPRETVLVGNYPNPFNPSTTIRYALGGEMSVSLRIYNTLGQLVATLTEAQQAAGDHEVIWDGLNEAGLSVAGGIYLYRMRAEDPFSGSGQWFVETKKLLLLR